MKKTSMENQTFFINKSTKNKHARYIKFSSIIMALFVGNIQLHADVLPGSTLMQPQVISTAPMASSPATPPPPSLEPTVADIPATYTFRSSCVTKSYKDAVYGDLIEPTLVKNADGTYTLHASCRNGVGVPTIDSTLILTLVVRNINNNGTNMRTISIRSKVGDKLRNCADISNLNGSIVCTPPTKK